MILRLECPNHRASIIRGMDLQGAYRVLGTTHFNKETRDEVANTLDLTLLNGAGRAKVVHFH